MILENELKGVNLNLVTKEHQTIEDLREAYYERMMKLLRAIEEAHKSAEHSTLKFGGEPN